MKEFSDHVSDNEGSPVLAMDGQTILVPLSGHTADGVYYDGIRQIRPGEPDYDDLLPQARANPTQVNRQSRAHDPETLARIPRAAGMESSSALHMRPKSKPSIGQREIQ